VPKSSNELLSGARRDAGRLFHTIGPLTAKLRWPVVVRALGTISSRRS